MRNQRGNKLDWSRPFKLVSSKKEFDLIEITENESISTNQTEENTKKQTHQDKKQQIVIPKIEIGNRVTSVKPFAGVPFEYIRLPQELNLPKLQFYELTEVDHTFLTAHQGRFKLNGKNVLDRVFLQKAFVQLELLAGKGSVIPKAKGWMTSFIERQYKEYTKMEKYQQLAGTVYNFWRNRREELKFPLLRPLWRPNPDEYNHLLAFKPRQKQKRNLRRANRVTDDEIGFQMYEQFTNVLKIVERIQKRQQLKLQSVQLQIMSFHSEAGKLSNKDKEQSVEKLFSEIKRQNWQENIAKNKEDVKAFSYDLDQYRKRREIKEEYLANEQNIDVVFDQRTTAANFLATVVSFAQNFGISFQSIFSNNFSSSNGHAYNSNISLNLNPSTKDEYIPTPPPFARQPSTGRFTVELKSLEKDQQNQVDKGEYLNFDLEINRGFVYRSLKEKQQSLQNMNEKSSDEPTTYNSFLEYKVGSVENYYFGEDDQGDFKDLKKNISSNFKRFLQPRKEE